MPSRSSYKMLKSILLIDLVIVSVAGGGYVFVQTLPRPFIAPADIRLGGLLVNSSELFPGQSIGVSVNVTNLGVDRGYYQARLDVDDSAVQNMTIDLRGGETKAVDFVESVTGEGTHSLGIGSARGAFRVLSAYALSDSAVNRTQAGVGEPVGISVRVTSKVGGDGNYSLTLKINGTVIGTQAVYLTGGAGTTVVFGVVEQAEGTYFYEVGGLNGTFVVATYVAPPKPAQFVLSNLAIDPEVADVGSAVNISVDVANVGEASGNRSLSLLINGIAVSAKEVQLSGGAKTTVLFTVTESVKGSYEVRIDNETRTLTVQDPSTITVYGLIANPYEVNGGALVNITLSAYNRANDSSALVVKLKIDGVVVGNTTIELAGLASINVEFDVTAKPLAGTADQELHHVEASGLTCEYLVVKEGYHTLIIQISPSGNVEFNINGEKYITSYYSEPLPEGSYVIDMPKQDPTGKYTFQRWSDGDTNNVKTITLTSRTRLIASFSGGSSCPSLYTWNGTGNFYVSEISNHGWLGYIDYINEDGTIVFYRNNPWDYIPLDKAQLQPTNGVFNLTLVQNWDEVFYLDQAYMVVVDHPANVNVYSTMVEQYLDPAYMGKLYTVSQNPQAPISAVNEKGEDVLPQISKMDGVFTTGTNGINSPSWDNISWSRLTLNLGDLSNASQIKLVIRAIVDWGSPDDYGVWLNKFFAQTVPNGTEVTPPPYMEVKDSNGNWLRVQAGRQIPLPPDGLARTFVVDLTGLFPTNDYSLRISNFWNVTFDYIGVDTTAQQNVTVTRIDPRAYLYQDSPSYSEASGNFTRYGDVTQLVLAEDDMFVIGRQGDAVSLQFNASGLGKPADGMVRDYFFYVACWFKDTNGNWGFGFGFTVDPLPFHNMSGFPYPPGESYPYDAAHLAYLSEYNTRVVAPP